MSKVTNPSPELNVADVSAGRHGHMSAETLVSGYGEPAVMLDMNGESVTANRHAQRIEHLFQSGVNDELARLANVARTGGKVVTATLLFTVDTGQVVFQTTIIPEVLGDQVLFLFHDQTLDHNLREALIESRQRFKDLVEVSTDFSWEADADGIFQFVSRSGALGYTPNELVGKNPKDMVVGAEEFDPLPFHTDKVVEDVELWMLTADGGMACVEVSAMPFFENDGTRLGVRGVCRDVTNERERATALAQAHQREQILGYIVNTIREEVNPSDMLGSAAAATARALGAEGATILKRVQLVASAAEGGASSPGEAMVVFEAATKFGSGGPGQFGEHFLDFTPGERHLHEAQLEGWDVMAAPCVHAGELKGVICLWRREVWTDDARLLLSDIANQLGVALAQIANLENIVRLSRTDAMTGLLNRRAFYDEELPRRFKRMGFSKTPDAAAGALYYVDMDNFKLVNDVFGHQKGDDAIIALRDLLHDFVRPGDLIARLGGDEFALWLDGVSEQIAVKRCGDLLRASKSLEKLSGSPEKPLGISVGIAIYHPSSGETLEGLLARADAAMYTVKQKNKGDFFLAPPYQGEAQT
jgi:diguanylate cyclase (GGDEF)-like protein/PAS domain S-box-containing protein